MLFSTLRLAFVTLALLVTGCAGTYKPEISEELRDSVSTAEVVSFIPQEEIDLQFNPSTAGSAAGAGFGAIGGMLGAIADAAANQSLAKKAEQRVQPFRDKLVEYDFKSVHIEQLKNYLNEVEWVTVSKLESELNREDFKLRDYLPEIDQDALLIIATSYSLSPDFDVLNINSSYSLYIKPTQKSKAKRPRYRAVASQFYQYQSPSKKRQHLASLPDFVAARDEITNKYQLAIDNAKTSQSKSRHEKSKRKELEKATKEALEKSPVNYDWTEEELTQQLNRGIEHILTMKTLDLNDQRSAKDYKALEEKISLISFNGSRSSSTVYLVDNYQGHNFYRAKIGSLYSVPETDKLRFRAALQ